ncbi:hypothetical protein C0991_004181 [Blastosporella zonata]|nr:hypothetical protein C0991_004181 [Blastosporella zonata]
MKTNAAFGTVSPVADRHHRLNGQPVSYTHSTSYGSISSTDVYGFKRGNLYSSPERTRQLESNTSSSLNVVPEDGIIMEFSSSETRTPRYTAGAPLDDDDEAAEEWELDEELEEQGLYRAFALLAALPYTLYPLTKGVDWPYPTVPYFPHPFPEILTSAALFSLSHLIRDPLISIIASIFPSPSAVVPTVLATALHTLLSLVLQQAALPLLLVGQYAPVHPIVRDAAFRRVWWLALGWATAEAVVGICQGYHARALYRDVLVTVHRSAETPTKPDGGPLEARAMGPLLSSGSRSPASKPASDPRGQSTLELFERQVEDDVYGVNGRAGQPFGEEEQGTGERQPLLPPKGPGSQDPDQAIKLLVEDELDELLAMRAREELEDAYGIPVIRIPVFISCLQRVNNLLLTLGIFLLLAQTYLRSPFAREGTSPNHALAITVPIVWIVQCYLALLHTPLFLPRMGVPAVVYSASLVSLGAFFSGLAMWEGLS